MKRIVLFLATSLFAFSIMAQSIGYVWGPELIQKKVGKFVPSIFGNKDGVLYGYRGYPADGFYFEKYNEQDLSLSMQAFIMDKKTLPPETSEYFRKALLMDDKIIAFFCTCPKKKDKNKNKEYKIVARTYDLDFHLINEKDLVTEVSDLAYDPFESIKFSPDSSKFAIIAIPDYRTPTKLTVNIFDLTFEVLDSKDLNFGSQYNNSYLLKYSIDNEGSVYFFYRDYLKKPGLMKGEGTKYIYSLYISQVGTNSKDVIHYEPKSTKTGKHIIDITYGISGKNEVSFVGFYSNSSKMDINGVFLFKYDIGNEKPKVSDYTAFENSFMQEFLSNKKVEDGAGIPSYNLDWSIFKEDGSVILIAEEYYSYTSCHTSSNGSSTCNTYYIYGDLLIANIGAEGNIINSSKIEKYTRSGVSVANSYMVGVSDGTIHIIYQRNREEVMKGKEAANSSAPFGWKKGIVAMHSAVKPDGVVETEMLFDCEKEQSALYLDYYKQINNNTMIITGRLKAWKLGKITF
jgi:hypothetical protein